MIQLRVEERPASPPPTACCPFPPPPPYCRLLPLPPPLPQSRLPDPVRLPQQRIDQDREHGSHGCRLDQLEHQDIQGSEQRGRLGHLLEARVDQHLTKGAAGQPVSWLAS